MNTLLYTRSLVLALALAVSSPTFAAADRQELRLKRATQVLDELQATPDQNVPDWLLERAYAVAIIPEVIKVGLLGPGARRGSGVLVTRQDDGRWSNPIFVNLTGGSLGFQFGIESTDVLLVFTSRASIEGIVGGKVTLGADASVAAGPVGRQTSAATDVNLTAQVLSYSRSVGLFAGVALDGSALTIDNKSNAAYYGRPGMLASEIMMGNAPRPPATAQDFITAINRHLGVVKPVSATSNSSPAAANATRLPSTAPSPKTAEPGKLTTRPMEDPNPGTEPPN